MDDINKYITRMLMSSLFLIIFADKAYLFFGITLVLYFVDSFKLMAGKPFLDLPVILAIITYFVLGYSPWIRSLFVKLVVATICGFILLNCLIIIVPEMRDVNLRYSAICSFPFLYYFFRLIRAFFFFNKIEM